MTSVIGLFLDTSILYSLRLKQPVLCRYIRKICRPSRVFTGSSRYSLVEFDQRVIVDADYLIKKIGELGYDEAREWVTHVLAQGHARKKTTCQSLFSLMDSQWRDNASRINRLGIRALPDMRDWAIDWLGHFIEKELYLLEKSVNHWNDGIGCGLASELLRKRKTGMSKPAKCDSSNCRLSSFLNDNRNELLEISQTIRNMPDKERSDELKDILDFIHAWMKNPDKTFKRSEGCLRIGDLLVALESGTFNMIYTQNVKEFKPLGAALGKIILCQSNQAKRPSVLRFPPKDINPGRSAQGDIRR